MSVYGCYYDSVLCLNYSEGKKICDCHIRNSRRLGRSVGEMFSGRAVLVCPISRITGRFMIDLLWN